MAQEKFLEEEYIASTNRIEAFSDGVIAIIVTLLILEIKFRSITFSLKNFVRYSNGFV